MCVLIFLQLFTPSSSSSFSSSDGRLISIFELTDNKGKQDGYCLCGGPKRIRIHARDASDF